MFPALRELAMISAFLLFQKNRPVSVIAAATLLAFFASAAATFFMAIHTFPLVDGWYETLIFLKSKGLQPYKDIEFVLPPVTPLFYSLMDWFTGTNFAAHKIIGVALSLLNAGLVYFWLSRTKEKTAALVASFAFFHLETTFPTYLARDYHSLVNLVSITCVGCMLWLTQLEQVTLRLKNVGALLGTGILTGLLILTKQNVGFVVGFAFVCFLLTHATFQVHRSRQAWLTQTAYLAAFTIGLVLALIILVKWAAPDMSVPGFLGSLTNVRSKGSPLYAGTRFFHDPNNRHILKDSLVMAGVWVFFATALKLPALKLWHEKLSPSRHSLLTDCFAVIGPALLGLTFLFFRPADGYEFIATLAVTAFLIDMVKTLQLVQKEPHAATTPILRLMLFGALIYANTLTASINLVGVGILIAFYLADYTAIVLAWMKRLPIETSNVPGMFFLFAIFWFWSSFESSKISSPYAWWDIKELSAISSTASSSLEPLKGMGLEKDRASLLGDYVQKIGMLTQSTDPILAYPNIPIFYLLADRKPAGKTFVQWFDFAQEETLRNDFRNIAMAPPKAVIELQNSENTYRGHEHLLGHPLIQKDFSIYLQCMVDHKAFDVVDDRLVAQSSYTLSSITPLNVSDIYTIASYISTIFPNTEIEGAKFLQNMIPIEGLHKLDVDPSAPVFSLISIRGTSSNIEEIERRWNATHAKKLSTRDNPHIRLMKRDDQWSDRDQACRSGLLQAIDLSASRR